MYITYDEYKAYGGKSVPEAFPRLESIARATVDYYTFRRIDKVTQTIKDCMLELITFQEKAEKISSGESSVVKSETVGDHTVSYASSTEVLGLQESGKSKKDAEYEIVAKYLMNTGLMYRGCE